MNDTPARKRPPVGSHPCMKCGTNHVGHGAHCDTCSTELARDRSQRHNQERADLHTAEWRRIRLAILTRDHHTCVVCAAGDQLQVHHLNGTPGDHRADNLVTLCARCHRYIEHDNLEAVARLGDHLRNSPHHVLR